MTLIFQLSRASHTCMHLRLKGQCGLRDRVAQNLSTQIDIQSWYFSNVKRRLRSSFDLVSRLNHRYYSIYD